MNALNIFFDNQIRKADKALLESLSPGVVEGDGVFETMRVRRGRIMDLDQHMVRLKRGLRLYKIALPYSHQQIKEYFDQILKNNRLKNAGIRLAVWKEGRKVRMSIVSRGRGSGASLERKFNTGFKAIISKVRRTKTRFSHIKSLDYKLFRDALLEAKSKGFDEAVLLNNQGEVVEGAVTNIFMIKRGTLLTPPVRCGCLNGITRRQVIQLARQAGIPFKAAKIKTKQLLNADEVFLTNSLMGIMPLTSLDGHKIGCGPGRGRGPGPITLSLAENYIEREA